MLGIKTKLLIALHLWIDGQTERINQELEWYLRFFVDHKQKNQLEQLVSAEFAANNKIYTAIKVSLFIANYRKKLRMETDIRKKEKIKKMTEFTEKMKKIQEEAGVVLRKVQKEMK